MNNFLRVILLALFLNIFSVLPAQAPYTAYYEKTISAYGNMAEGNYSLAAKLYEEAFADNLPFPDDLANLRDCYLAMGDTASAVNCVERMIACGWQLRETYPVMDFTPMENRIGSFDSVRIAHITAIYPALRQKYLQQIDPALNAYLERIVLNEIFCQEVRDGAFGEERWTNAPFAQNAADLCDLLKNKELDRKHVDVWNSQLLQIALVHCAKALGLKEYARDTLYTGMMELLKQEVLKGNLYPDVYASVYDIVYWFNYGKSYYGRQLTFDPETGKHRCVEIEDAATVDKRRAAIGLPPVWAFCKKYNIVPPANLVSNARVTAVRCTEDDYNEAKKSIFACSCLSFSIPNFSPADSMHIDSLLRHDFLAADGFDKPEYDLWWDRNVLQREGNNCYIVRYGPEFKGSGDPVATGRTAFIDTLFQPKGSIVGELASYNCCARRIATFEWRLDEPPILHLYRWDYKNALPKEIGQYAPNDFVAEACWWEGDVLYVKGYELIEELYKGDTIYMRISLEE